MQASSNYNDFNFDSNNSFKLFLLKYKGKEIAKTHSTKAAANLSKKPF